MPGSFADTNVLLYLVAGDARKALVSEQILRSKLTISVQVLNEAANVLRRKHGADWPVVDDVLDTFREGTTVLPVTVDTHDLGLRVARRHQLGIYDGMIVAAALLADCDTLYSEDMHDGLLVDGRLTIVNPFRDE